MAFLKVGTSNVPIWALGVSCETPAASVRMVAWGSRSVTPHTVRAMTMRTGTVRTQLRTQKQIALPESSPPIVKELPAPMPLTVVADFGQTTLVVCCVVLWLVLCVGVCFCCLFAVVVVCRFLLWFVGYLWLWFVWCVLW